MQILSETQIYAAAKAAGFSPAESVIATAIAMAESGGDPAATHHNTNGSTDYGLWQINSVHADLFTGGANWKDPLTNARMARSVYQSQGWHAWSTYNSGAYRKEMDAELTATLKASHDTVPNSTGYAAGSTTGSAVPNTQNANWLTDIPGKVGGFFAGGGLLGQLGLMPGGMAALFTVEFWERAGWGLLGFFLVLFGFIFLVESNKTARTLTETAALA